MTLSIVSNVKSIGSKHIVVLYGGLSSERNISIETGNGVISALVELGFAVTSIDVGQDIVKILASLSPAPEIIFNCLHGKFGEDGSIQGLLNLFGVPYTHCGVAASVNGFDKSLAHWIFSAHGIPVPETKVVSKNSKISRDPMPRPFVIKPVDQGSSIGVQVIHPETDFNFGNYDFAYGSKILVQKFIKGRELNVAVLNGKCLHGILEIQFTGDKRWFDFDAKYTAGFVKHSIPPEPKLEDDICKRVYGISEKVYNVLGCRGLCRVELIFNEETKGLFVLEINTHPGLTPMSICPEIAEYCGISYKELVNEMVKSATLD